MQRVEIKIQGTNKTYSCDSSIEVRAKDKVVADLNGVETFGEVITAFDVGDEKPNSNKVIRLATKVDIDNASSALKTAVNAYKVAKEKVKNLNLDMNIVGVNCSLDLSKIIIEFVAEDRVDFRELVKELVHSLKSRIELRQITVREQAQIVGGIGSCGRICCCASFLKDFEKVSMKMAKTQGLSLNPTKISGACGRLMCCLEYENPFYQEVANKMPKINSEVKTKDGKGTVVYQDLLKEIVSVKFVNKDETVTIKDYNLSDIKF